MDCGRNRRVEIWYPLFLEPGRGHCFRRNRPCFFDFFDFFIFKIWRGFFGLVFNVFTFNLANFADLHEGVIWRWKCGRIVSAWISVIWSLLFNSKSPLPFGGDGSACCWSPNLGPTSAIVIYNTLIKNNICSFKNFDQSFFVMNHLLIFSFVVDLFSLCCLLFSMSFERIKDGNDRS